MSRKPKTKNPRIKIDEYYQAGKINEFQKVALEKLAQHYEVNQNLHNISHPSYELPIFVDRNLKEHGTLIKLSEANFYKQTRERFANKDFSIRITRNRYKKVSGTIIFYILVITFIKNMSRDESIKKIAISPRRLPILIKKGLEYL